MSQNKKTVSPEQLKDFFQQITEHIINSGGTAEITYSPEENKLGAKLKKEKSKLDTSDTVARIFAESAIEVLEIVSKVKISCSPTIQKVSDVHIRPDVGCFVQFSGDYSGLFIMNFSAKAAMKLYRGSMINMGLPESDLSIDYTADDVVDTLGELINQVIGNARNRINQKYGLVSNNTQPKAISVNNSVTLSIETKPTVSDFFRRLSLTVDNEHFHIELALENTEFNKIENWDLSKKDSIDTNLL